MSFAQNGAQSTSVKIIHHVGNEVQFFDTLFSITDDYSAEQYILDKGFDPNSVEIIQIEGRGEQGVWVMEAEITDEIVWKSDDEHVPKQLFIRKRMDGGRDFDMEERFADIIRTSEKDSVQIERFFDVDVDFEALVGEDGKEHEVKVVKVINDDGDQETRTWINGEEVDPETVEGNTFIIDGTDQMEVKIEKILSEYDNETEGGQKVIVIEKERSSQINDENIFIEREPNMESFTIALVSEVNTEMPENRAHSVELQIDDLNFFPNPNEGRFSLQFTLPQEGSTQVELFNTSGQRIYSEDLGTFSGFYRSEIDISDQPTGNYILHVTQNGRHLAEKVIVK